MGSGWRELSIQLRPKAQIQTQPSTRLEAGMRVISRGRELSGEVGEAGRLAFSRRRFPTPGPGGQHGTSLHAVIKSCADARDDSRT